MSDNTEFDINWREVSEMTKFANWFSANPVRNIAYIAAGIAAIAGLSYITGFYGLFL